MALVGVVADLRDGSSERPDEQRAAARLLRAGPAGAAGPRARPLARNDADAAQGHRHVAHDPLNTFNQNKCTYPYSPAADDEILHAALIAFSRHAEIR